jgi:hypothetical protein
MAFLALRNLALLGYWSQDETWPLIGYRGPLIASPRSPLPDPPRSPLAGPRSPLAGPGSRGSA